MPHPKTGLYDPAFEHDACGVAFVARLDGRARRTRRSSAPRGAREPRAPRRRGRRRGHRRRRGHPDPAARRVLPRELGDALPPAGAYGVGVVLPPADDAPGASSSSSSRGRSQTRGSGSSAGATSRSTRSHVGRPRRRTCRVIRQVVVAAAAGARRGRVRAQALRHPARRRARGRPRARRAEPLVADARLQGDAHRAAARAASTPTSRDERFESALALVHSRFSTNTFPSWELAHPYRLVAHNGEINTLRGNVNWMRARESQLASELFGDDLAEGAAGDPAGRLRHGDVRQRARAARARGPLAPARADDDDPRGVRGPRRRDDELRGFYDFHGCLIEAWDGPAAIAFTDGRVIGATLDRNGLRPGRWYETADGWVVLASETGVLDDPPENDRAQGAPPARQALPRRPRRRADRPRRRAEGARRGAAAVRTLVRRRTSGTCPTCRRPACRRARRRSRSAAGSSCSATRRRT